MADRPSDPIHDNDRTALAAFVLTVVLIAVGSLWPQSRLWGVAWYQFFPWYVGASVATISVVAVAWWGRTHSERDNPSSVASLAVPLIVSLGLLLFVVLRTRTHFLGDGYILLGRLESGTYTFQPWEFGPFTLERWVFDLLGHSVPVTAFRVISWASGALYMIAVWWAAYRLYDDAARRLWFAGGLLTGGYLLLYFGYVEHYPLFVATVAAFTFTGLFVAQGRCHRLWIVPSLVFGLVLHPFGVVMVIPAGYLLFRDSPLQRVYERLSRPVRIAIPAKVALLAIALFVYFYVTHLFFRLSFVPPWTDRFTVEGYTLFSWHHLVDVFSLILQLAPGLLIFVAVVFALPVRAMLKRPEYRFLVLLSVLSLVMAFVFDPKIGLPRDWDLFAFAGIPLTVLAFRATLDHSAPRRYFAPVAMIVVSLLVLIPRVATQVSSDKSIAVFRYFADLDPIRNKDGQTRLIQYYRQQGLNGRADSLAARVRSAHPELALHEQAMSLTRAGKLDQAIATYKKALAIDPSMATSWANIGFCFLNKEQPDINRKLSDSAVVYLEIANAVQPYNPITLRLLGDAYYGAGHDQRAEQLWLEVLRLQPNDVETYKILLQYYRGRRRIEDTNDLLERLWKVMDTAQAPVLQPGDSGQVDQ